MKAALTRYSVESSDNHSLIERLMNSQNDSDNLSQNRIKRIEDQILKISENLKERIDESNEESDNNILQLNKQIVNFETKTANLENLIQSIVDETKVKFHKAVRFIQFVFYPVTFSILALQFTL